jgi:hypothetical protein
MITKRKSTRSSESANCVALMEFSGEDLVAVADTKSPAWQVVWFDRAAWGDFVRGVADGEFDREGRDPLP